jgi:hypothetical protein
MQGFSLYGIVSKYFTGVFCEITNMFQNKKMGREK